MSLGTAHIAAHSGASLCTALALAAAWSWAGIQPESSWPGIALVTVLAVSLPNLAACIETWRSGNMLRAGAMSSSAVGLAGTYEVWTQWSEMTYDRGTGSALAQATVYGAAVVLLAGAGFASLVVVNWLMARNGKPAAA